METIVKRESLRDLLVRLTTRHNERPKFPIFSVKSARRTPLYLRYPPVSDTQNGPLVRDGDYCRLEDKGREIIRDKNGNIYEMNPTGIMRERHLQGRSPVFLRRGNKIILEDVGTFRWMVVKNYDPNQRNDTKHHRFVLGGRSFIEPDKYDLFLVRGMYNDMVKSDGRIGRHGQWRPFAQVCLRSTVEIKVDGHRYIIPDPVLSKKRER